MGFSLKRALKVPKSIRKWQPLKSPIVRAVGLGIAGVATGGLGAAAAAAAGKIGTQVKGALGAGEKLGERVSKAGSALAGVGKGLQSAVTSFRSEAVAGAAGSEAGVAAGAGTVKALPWILGAAALGLLLWLRRKGR